MKTTVREIQERLCAAEESLARLEALSLRRCFLAQDHEDRWYVIPVDFEDEWDELLCLIEAGEAMTEEWHLWEERYGPLRLQHDLSHYSFMDFRKGHNPR